MKKLIFLFLLLVNLVSFSQTQVSILSWNIRDFGKTKSEETIQEIANIVKDYDIVVLQEVVAGYGGTQVVAKLVDELNRKGSKWDYVISNPTQSPPYKTERYAFLWKPHKVKTEGRGNLIKQLQTIVYREPFSLVFIKNGIQFKILNYHSRKHDDHPEVEIDAIINYIISNKENLILVGDFNTTEDDEVFNNFYNEGYISVFKNKKTTLKRKCKNNSYRNYAIDNIYLSVNKNKIKNSKVIDFVLSCENLTNARKISDHLPIATTIELQNCVDE